MKKLLAILLGLQLINAKGMGQSKKFDFSYAIFFGSNFEKDTVSLKINNIPIGSNYIITSSKMMNVALTLRLRQTSKGVVVFYKGKEFIKPKVKHNNFVMIELTVNSNTIIHQLDLNEGQVLLVNYSGQADGNLINRKISIEQYKEALIII